MVWRAWVLSSALGLAAAVSAAPDTSALTSALAREVEAAARAFARSMADGTLALSTGPAPDPAGKPVARFNSVWRLEAPRGLARGL